MRVRCTRFGIKESIIPKQHTIINPATIQFKFRHHERIRGKAPFRRQGDPCEARRGLAHLWHPEGMTSLVAG